VLLAGVLASLWGATVSRAVAQPAAPSLPVGVAETPASDMARRMIQTAKEGDAAFIAFTHANHQRIRPDDQWLQLREQVKDLQIHAVEQASATHAELMAFDSNLESWVRLTIDVTPAEPHKTVGLNLRLVPRPADVPAPPRLAPAALVAATRARAEAAAKADSFSGAVFIAQGGKPVLEAAYGLADRDARTPNTTQTQFRFGSMGKMFTAVAIMQLAQAGKLDLTAPIGRYLTDYPNADIAAKVTINHLLTHTGGTGDIFAPEYFARRLEVKDPKDYVALFGARPPRFAPGERQEYSNYGFMLLGRIVEVVSGQSYDDYIAAHILAPAHMTATGNSPETVALPHRAVGYTGSGSGLKSAADTLPWRGTPAGGGYSTVGDLAKFADALMANRLLDAAHTRLLTTGGFAGPEGKLLRYDFGAPAGDGRRYFGHSGGAPGMNGELRIFPAEPGHDAATIVVLANRDPPVASGVANFISDRLP
jgi:CubicO group peptidase (beta-lactamase class C family)